MGWRNSVKMPACGSARTHRLTKINRIGGRWSVEALGGVLSCDAVLLATNAYSSELTRSLAPGIARSIVPVTSWQMATEPVDDHLREKILPGRQAVSDTRKDLRFFRYDARNHLVAGGAILNPLNAGNRIKKDRRGAVARGFSGTGKARVYPCLVRLCRRYTGPFPTFSQAWTRLLGRYWI